MCNLINMSNFQSLNFQMLMGEWLTIKKKQRNKLLLKKKHNFSSEVVKLCLSTIFLRLLDFSTVFPISVPPLDGVSQLFHSFWRCKLIKKIFPVARLRCQLQRENWKFSNHVNLKILYTQSKSLWIVLGCYTFAILDNV